MRKYICAILIIVLISCNACVYSANKSVEDYEKQIEELNSQINQDLKNLEVVEEELTQNLIQLQELNEQIQESEQELEKLNNEIKELDIDIENKQEELNEKQKECDRINKLAENIIVAMYEGGEIQYLDVLMGSKNIMDFVSNYFLLSELMDYNIQLIEEATNQKKQVEELVQSLENQKQITVEKKKEQQKISQSLENTKTSKQYYVSKLTQEEKQIQTQIDEYKSLMAEAELEIRKLSIEQNFGKDYIGEKMIWPVPGYKRITSKYGMRDHPITGVYKMHSGVDVGAPEGTKFVAMASGVITKAEYNKYYGNMVIIDHGGGVQTLYAHGSEILVKKGDLVAQGESVLKVGSTGLSTGAHAHFEVRINGSTVNPLDYVSP